MDSDNDLSPEEKAKKIKGRKAATAELHRQRDPDGIERARRERAMTRFRNKTVAELLLEERKSSKGARQAVEVRSSRRCARCNRWLTDPVSIERGYGPQCYET